MAFDILVTEIETKYNADNFSLIKFNEFAQSLLPLSHIEVSSWDTYYSPKATGNVVNPERALPFEFLRFREGGRPELTTKVQLNDKNNNQRIEIDLPLSPNTTKEELKRLVDSFCGLMGFEQNFRIFKYCSIFFYQKLDIVYYIVYDENLQEKGRFLEIEARKDAIFKDADEAWGMVLEMEQKLSALGITPQHRIKKSQWQMWRK